MRRLTRCSPFARDLLSVDTTVTPEKGHELADKVVAELNCCSTTLKDLFLVKDIFESVKFGFVLYLFTYLGAWFNTMTLVIMGESGPPAVTLTVKYNYPLGESGLSQ